jgi:hypothetical protein
MSTDQKPLLRDLDLRAEWVSYRVLYSPWDYAGFLVHLRERVRNPRQVEPDVKFCYDCSVPGIEVGRPGGTHPFVPLVSAHVCPDCIRIYNPCDQCTGLVRYPSVFVVDGQQVRVCNRCRDNYFTWCDPCGAWFHNDEWDPDDHQHPGPNCKCESPAQVFQVRNDGHEPLANDEFTIVTLPSGVISDEGMAQIASHLRWWGRRVADPYTDEYHDVRGKWNSLSRSLEVMDARWQTKQGNFTKRLSRFAYKEYGLKVPPELLSEIGNMASQQSGGAEYKVAFTRNLNLPAGDFANYDSCWWGSYAASRCALKSNGGFALRTFNTYDGVTGRAWVMPLRSVGTLPNSGELAPTFETLDADAFIVFNGYGDMHGYIPARIMAHLAGMTYRKVGFAPGESVMYVNNEWGYLVAPEEIADRYNDGEVYFDLAVHSNLYAQENPEQADVA